MRKFFSPCFSGASLKSIACFSMFIDHMGLLLFPDALFLRIIGRLAFPIFAFFIAEGCRYTTHPLRRFLSVFLLGVVCEAANIAVTGAWYGNILLTFSVSILLISLLQAWKKALCGENRRRTLLLFGAFLSASAAACVLISFVGIDYGFPGVMVPVLISLFDYREGASPEAFKPLDRPEVKLAVTAFALMPVCLQRGVHPIQIFCLFALPLLALYNGTPGKHRFKYGFYVFYPAHLLILLAAAMLIH